MQKDYYLGLDLGTDSLGWAVTDLLYNILKYRGNAMWGIRLFDESQTAAKRRTFRTARRRLQRVRERLNLLEMIFDREISSIDLTFFQRLKESNLYLEDKTTKSPYSIFTGDYTDKDFHKAYPTVFHLRKDLIENPKEHDIRLVFLALHHIIKSRGHFLYDTDGFGEANNFTAVFSEFSAYLKDNYEIELQCDSISTLEEVLKDRSLTKTKKIAKITPLFGITKKEPREYACLSLMCGAKVNLCDVFADDSLKEAEERSVTFSSGYDEKEALYEALLGERFELIEKIKSIYDWAVLADILDGEKYLSFAKVKSYEQHKSDLKELKRYVKAYKPREDYIRIFKTSAAGLNNYAAYSKHVKQNGKTGVVMQTCKQEDFCKFLKTTLGKCENEEYSDMFARIEAGTFMPKQITADNGVIPMQVHMAELIAILNNAKSYLPFLTQKDEEGYTPYDKIISVFGFRIPYYVGPLNKHSNKAWLVRSNEKIYPWNFSKVVDLDKSAEAFIRNLTSKCTYLPEFDVIPQSSLLYSKYTVLNELNNLKIDSQPISVSLKQEIYEDLFLHYNKVTGKKLRNYLLAKGISFITLSGFDNDFKSSLKSHIDFAPYTKLSYEEKEEIIKAITIFGDDKSLLKKRLKQNYAHKLTAEEINKISKLKYSKWGRFSKELLCDTLSINPETGEVINFISAMWDTNLNFMELLHSDSYGFKKAIEEKNSHGDNKSIRQQVEEMYVSPKVKRPIYQALQIIEEITKIQGCAPKKVFIEVPRYQGEKNKRTVSRKARLLDLYKACKDEYKELYSRLENIDEERLRSDKLYLYFTQFGKCMYSGEIIHLEQLMHSNTKWDIDHIFPQSKIKDDSLDNRVLVNKEINSNIKKDIYPINSEIQNKMSDFWKMLKNRGLISEKKYERLVRKTRLTDDELSAFISRQIVETAQSTKAVAEILQRMLPSTEIVYVKAGLVSDFRHDFDMLKCREVNDFHHAKDAYLNIVVGNVYNEKFTHNRINFIKGLQKDGPGGESLNAMYSFDIKNAWSKDTSMGLVRKTMAKNNILYTRYSFTQQGGLFNQTIYKKGKNLIPIKGSGARSNTEKYGGYNSAASSYFALVKYKDIKEKEIVALIPIDLYSEKEYKTDPIKYLTDKWGILQGKVVIPKIKYNSYMSFNGMRVHLSSKSSGGAQIVFKPANQLVLGYEWEKYIKKIVNYTSKYISREVDEFDGIDQAKNAELYKILYTKMTTTAFAVKFDKLGTSLRENEERFIGLSSKEQCIVISEILKILHANVMSGDLSNLGLAKKSGILTFGSKFSAISGINSVKLIHQSVTGLYEQEIELLK